MQERRDRLAAAKNGDRNGLRIVEEVGKLAQQRGFVACPMNRDHGPVPPPWVQNVLVGIEEGRLHDRDFYTNSW